MELELASQKMNSMIRRRIEGVRPKAEPQGPEKDGGRLNTGTAILAFKYRDGVMMTADRQVTGWRKIVSDSYRKIDVISPYSLAACTGTVAEIQLVYDIYNELHDDFCSRTNGEPSLGTQVKILKSILRNLWLGFGYLDASFIFAGFDSGAKKSVIMSLSQSSMVLPLFAADGSGWNEVSGVMNQYFRAHTPEDIDFEEAVRLALQAEREAGKGDPYVSDATVVPPSIAYVAENGVHELSDDEVREALRTIDKERKVKRGRARK